MIILIFLYLVSLIPRLIGLNNGLGLVPPMGEIDKVFYLDKSE
jgi:hypothetical protein